MQRTGFDSRRRDRRLAALAVVVASGLGLQAWAAQASVVTIDVGTAVSFQDEGTLTADNTILLATLDGLWAPTIPAGGTVTEPYYATGTSDRFFDAISLNFDLGPIGYANVTGATLRFYTQKGDYATLDGTDSFSASRNTWEHYEVLQGAMNSTHEDVDPFTASATDFYGAGTLAQNATLGWAEQALDTAWITSDSFDLTLRLWNARIDRIELRVSAVPEPATLLLAGLALAGTVRRRRASPARRPSSCS